MNAKLIFKTIFLLLMLLLLVLIGLNNQNVVAFSLPPVIKRVNQPAAIMYFGFFAIGLLTGTVLTAGGGKKGSAAAKPAKSGR